MEISFSALKYICVYSRKHRDIIRKLKNFQKFWKFIIERTDHTQKNKNQIDVSNTKYKNKNKKKKKKQLFSQNWRE